MYQEISTTTIEYLRSCESSDAATCKDACICSNKDKCSNPIVGIYKEEDSKNVLFSEFSLLKYQIDKVYLTISYSDAENIITISPKVFKDKENLQIKEVVIDCSYCGFTSVEEKVYKLSLLFPNVKKITMMSESYNLISYFPYIQNTYSEADTISKKDRVVDIRPKNYYYDNYLYLGNPFSIFRDLKRSQKDNISSNQIIALIDFGVKSAKYFSYDAIKVNFKLEDSTILIDSGYAIVQEPLIGFKNLNMIDGIFEDFLQSDLSEFNDVQINNLTMLNKMFEKHRTSNSDKLAVFPLVNIREVKLPISYPFDDILITAKKFYFYQYDNLNKNFIKEDKLVSNVPDYISMGINKTKSKNFKEKGTPVSFVYRGETINVKTAALLCVFNNKNIISLESNSEIEFVKESLSKTDELFLKSIRKLDSLKQLKIIVHQQKQHSFLDYNNLTKERFGSIIDLICGVSKNSKAPPNRQKIINKLRSLQIPADFVKIYYEGEL